MAEQFQEYLGDGVYASFDGYQIWLAANHHENRVIALEPAVFAALVRYAKKFEEERSLDHLDILDNVSDKAKLGIEVCRQQRQFGDMIMSACGKVTTLSVGCTLQEARRLSECCDGSGHHNMG